MQLKNEGVLTMAKMIPSYGPAETESRSEPLIYDILRTGLSDDYTVIHSLPWLSSAAKEIDEQFIAPTGEIDFLIVHPELGLLAIEVKGGKYRIEGSAFVLMRGSKRVDVLKQTRDNTHGLARWLAGKHSIHRRIGYALCFPDSQFPTHALPPGLVDPCGITYEAITWGLLDMPKLSKRVEEVMRYWKNALGYKDLGFAKANELIKSLCPDFDGTPSWAQRVIFDNHFWLRLTDEQSKVVNQIITSQRSIVTGWPGTGKTLIGIEAIRRLESGGAKVLLVTFNALLADFLSQQLGNIECDVFTWHKLCFQARAWLKLPAVDDDNWLSDTCSRDLQGAIDNGFLSRYDILMLDEAQALKPSWCKLLLDLFSQKQVVVFCDETQVFSFEKEPTSLSALSGFLDGVKPSYLTIVMRMPRAVTDRLLEVKPSSFQLSSPRKSDDDTVRELVVDGLESCMRIVIDDLLDKGIQEEDIVILSKFGDMPSEAQDFMGNHPKIKIEMVSRFRGMEAAVILVVWADEFSDAELFSAYSRATTLCLALFSAKKLTDEPRGAFLPKVIANVENRNVLQKFRDRTKTSNLLADHRMDRIENLHSLELYWSREWNCWMVQRECNSSLSLWIDFLVVNYPWPVLYWEKDSQHTLHLARRSVNGEQEIFFTRTWLEYCAHCDQLTPSKFLPRECYICDKEIGSTLEVLRRKHVREIVEYDVNLKSAISSSNMQEFQNGLNVLPFVLAVAAAGEYAARRVPDALIRTASSETSGSDFYRWATIYVKALIVLGDSGNELLLSNIASITYHFQLVEFCIDERKWYGIVALALNFHARNGHLERVGKGKYKIVKSLNNDGNTNQEH
jgi:hypothetical protein